MIVKANRGIWSCSCENMMINVGLNKREPSGNIFEFFEEKSVSGQGYEGKMPLKNPGLWLRCTPTEIFTLRDLGKVWTVGRRPRILGLFQAAVLPYAPV